MHRATSRFFVIAALMCAALSAQQPNSPTARQSVFGVDGAPFPLRVGGLQGQVVPLELTGVASAPFILAYGPIRSGQPVASGLLDLDIASPNFGVALNGLDPGSPTFTLARLNASGVFTVTFPYPIAAAFPTGTQALILDPTAPGGLRLSAAADYAPAVPEALSVHLGGQGGALWSNNGGSSSTPSMCSPGALLNNELLISFGGQVDPMSLPAPGAAVGSINIFRAGASPGSIVPADGVFVVRDDPRVPAPNGRLVSFHPSLSSPLTCASGLAPDTTYTLFIPATGQAPHVVRINGQPLATSVFACFTTPSCNPANPQAVFVDPVPGSPRVVASVPLLANPSPAPIPAASVPNNTVSVTISEALVASTVSLQSVRLVNQSNGAQVPGMVHYVGQGEQGLAYPLSRIDYVAFDALAPGSVFRLELSPTLVDVYGNALEPVPGMTGVPLFFQTVAVAPTPKPPIIETFQTAQNAASVPLNMSWGGGSVNIIFAAEISGLGAFGPMVFGPGSHTLDTGGPAVPGFANGVWDATTIQVAVGATVRIFGPFTAHLRCMGPITIDGTINANAGSMPGAPPPETGAASGAFNNGSGGFSPSIVVGGLGGPGGGDGGNASSGGLNRTPAGSPGFGPRIAGLGNVGPVGANSSYAGGEGGVSGFRFPAGGVMGELGGLGGAGGTAFTQGGRGGPFLTMAAGCMPYMPAVQTISLPAPVPPSFVAPLTAIAAGSGGGAGGDRHEVLGPQNDDQGGGGGGGGGGLRISSLSAISVSGSISANGGNGGLGNVFFAGSGGGGSGGQIWIQSAGALVIASSAAITAFGGVGTMCGDGGGGSGGQGLIQLEDDDGMINTGFMNPQGTTNVAPLIFNAQAASQGVAISSFFDTGSPLPSYTSASAVITSGPTSTELITFQGAHPQVGNPLAPDPQTLSPAVPAAQIGTLSGYRFIRFSVQLSYAPFPVTQPTTMLSSVTNVTINYSAP